MMATTGIVGQWVRRPSAKPDGAPADFGQDRGVVVHVAFPGPGAPLALLVAREEHGTLEWWGLEPTRPVALAELPEPDFDELHA